VSTVPPRPDGCSADPKCLSVAYANRSPAAVDAAQETALPTADDGDYASQSRSRASSRRNHETEAVAGSPPGPDHPCRICRRAGTQLVRRCYGTSSRRPHDPRAAAASDTQRYWLAAGATRSLGDVRRAPVIPIGDNPRAQRSEATGHANSRPLSPVIPVTRWRR
jgi:hypothetical protein